MEIEMSSAEFAILTLYFYKLFSQKRETRSVQLLFSEINALLEGEELDLTNIDDVIEPMMNRFIKISTTEGRVFIQSRIISCCFTGYAGDKNFEECITLETPGYIQDRIGWKLKRYISLSENDEKNDEDNKEEEEGNEE